MIDKKSENTPSQVAKILKNGGICISPTDTVYGILADSENKSAIEKIYQIKNRDKSKKIALFCQNIDQIKEICDINVEIEEILKNLLPEKFTFVLNTKKNAKTSLICDFKYETIGVRIPKDEFILSLLSEFKKPIASTSANISNERDTSVFSNLNPKILSFADEIVFDENTKENKPSCVIDLTKYKSGTGFEILRFGDSVIKFINFINKKNQRHNLQKLINIGPAMEKAMIACKIFTKEEFLSQDFVEIYKKLCLHNSFFIHKMVFYALFGAAYDVNCVKIPNDLKKIADEIWENLPEKYKLKNAK